MEERPATLGIQVELGPDADDEEVAEATLQLRRELLDLDVDSVDLPTAGQPPPGTRGVELAALRSWLGGSPQRSIKLELEGDTLELTGISATEQRRLVDEWLQRHTPR